MTDARFYDAVWAHYDALDRRSPAAWHRRRLVCALARRARQDVDALLDVGCGTGLLLADLAASYPSARHIGAEPSPHARAIAAARCPDAELTAHALDETLRAEQLGVPAGFDLVTCSEVLEHLEDDLRAAQRLRALLSPRGRLIVTVPGDRRTRFDSAIGHRRHYTVASLRALLEAAGFDVLDAFAWGFPFHSLYRAAVRVASRVAIPRRAAEPPRLGPSLSGAYKIAAAALRPLYALNVTGYGGQLVALARSRPGTAATTS